VSGDPREIREAVDKVKKAVGPDAESLVVEEGDGVVALGLDPDYVRTLAEAGGLGDDAVFQDVVPDADRAGGALFVNFDSVEEWVAQAMSGAGQMAPDEKQVRENLAPLRALGMSSWVEDDGSQGGLLRLSTD
jgi:hypothetical protein